MPPSTPVNLASPLRKMEWFLALLLLVCMIVWLLPDFLPARTVHLMPLWLHTIAEVFAVSVSFLLFGIVWNAYSHERSGNLVILGCAALAVGLLDLGHALSYRGMPDFITPSGPAKGINFWLAARTVAALSLLAVAIRRPLPLKNDATRYLLLGASLAISALVFWLALFHPSWWPVTFVDGVGLTPMKIAAESAIIGVLAVCAVLFHRRARADLSIESVTLFGVAVIGIFCGVCFSAYVTVNDIFNLLGHSLKIVAYLFLYRVGFASSVREPFTKLRVEVGVRQRADEALRQLNLTLEQRVLQRTRELEEANRELEAFSYSVSHDLRAPLRAIAGFSQNLQKNYHASLDERGKDYLGRVCRASERMSELIDDILHLSQVGRQQLVTSQVDLSALANAIARDLRNSAPGHGGRFEVAPGMRVEADPKLIRIVLENLMGNAWKFSARHAAPVITLGISPDGGVFVRDNGAGFSMEYAHKLFAPFQRLHSAAEFAGTGIGLATVQRIIHRHGGRVWAEGAEGQGATFHFTCAGHPQQVMHV